jgi:SAM-dependent methyltransferase
MKTVFDEIYEKNKWNSKESVSGVGSTLRKTKKIREFLPEIIKDNGIKSILDAPCGDFNWMKEVDLNGTKYIGGDIVKPLVDKCNETYESEDRTFVHLDISSQELPNVDAILCRDCMIHLPNEKVLEVLRNIKKAGIRWALLTTYPEVEKNKKIKEGSWRKVNLQAEPFNLPEPTALYNEGETGWNAGKYIGVWDFTKLSI